VELLQTKISHYITWCAICIRLFVTLAASIPYWLVFVHLSVCCTMPYTQINLPGAASDMPRVHFIPLAEQCVIVRFIRPVHLTYAHICNLADLFYRHRDRASEIFLVNIILPRELFMILDIFKAHCEEYFFPVNLVALTWRCISRLLTYLLTI